MPRPNRRDQWARDVIAAKKLPSSTRLFLSSVLSRHMRQDGRVSHPRGALAREMGSSERSIDRHYARAVDAGWLQQTGAGFLGHTAEFNASWPDEMHGSMRDKSGAHMSDTDGAHMCDRNCAHMRDKNGAPSSSTYGTNGSDDYAALPGSDRYSAERRNTAALELESSIHRSGRNHLRAVPA